MNNGLDNICKYQSGTCQIFDHLTDDMIHLVKNFYYTLQIYSNNVFDMDNSTTAIGPGNNFGSAILAQRLNKTTGILVRPDYMNLLLENVIKLVGGSSMVNTNGEKIASIIVGNGDSDVNYYRSLLSNVTFFGGGDLSPTIIIKATRNDMPLIIKISPLKFPVQDMYAVKESDEISIGRDIESPNIAIYYKEAFMYCFTKQHLQQYCPTFNCIAECLITEGFLFEHDEFVNMYAPYAEKRQKSGKKPFNKKWMNEYIAHPDIYKNQRFGIFELAQIEGTFMDIYETNQKNINSKDRIDLGMIFEYFYAKLVSSVVGRVIFTDDHFGNVAYITVNYWRHYTIVSGGVKYEWYIPPGKMIQFIDLERYVFDLGETDVYTNAVLKKEDLENTPINNQYMSNNQLIDKIIYNFKNILKNGKPEILFYQDEIDYIKNIIDNPLLGYNVSFGSVFARLPQIKYRIKPLSYAQVKSYSLILDSGPNQTKPVISKERMERA